MQTKIVEAEQPGSGQNWGKFLVMRPDDEWRRTSAISGATWPLLREIGWGPDHIIVFDLQTCEGAAFSPGGLARADLNKHRIHVCVLFEAFLEWLYKQDLADLTALPDRVEVDAEFALAGYRRPGQDQWRPEWAVHPGEVLQEEIDERCTTQAALAERLGCSAKHLNQVCRGHIGVSAPFALQLEQALGINAELWLGLQTAWDLHALRRRHVA